jgi:hypothetical protein
MLIAGAFQCSRQSLVSCGQVEIVLPQAGIWFLDSQTADAFSFRPIPSRVSLRHVCLPKVLVL